MAPRVHNRFKPGSVASLLLLCLLPALAWAQIDDLDGTAEADSLATEEQTGLGAAMSEALNNPDIMRMEMRTALPDTGPFFTGFKNTPKAGAKANVRQNTYYGEWMSVLSMRRGATFTNTAKWSYDEYRKQNKTAERRTDNFSYGVGQNLPLIVRLDGQTNWSQDKTTNTAGFANLFAQNNKSLRLLASKLKARQGMFVHNYRFGASINKQQTENQGTANNLQEGSLDGGLQTGWRISPGLVLAGRIFGTTTSGTKTLGLKDSPSSAQGDTVGVGIYFDKGVGIGRVAVTRANFSKKYLDFRKNSSGLIDTVGVSEDLKIVEELETKDALSLEFENKVRVGRVSLTSELSRTKDDLDYASSGLGLKERQQDEMKLGSGTRVGVDSVAVSYSFMWKWDDQRIQGATTNRGRQYNKNRDMEIIWTRPLFKETDFRLRYHEGLSQDIAQFEHNKNDKDRLQNDFSLQLDRQWVQKLRVKMVYTYRQIEDLSIRDTRSSNNNIKDTYEITPAYTWYVAPWLTWDQNYRVNIQYTDYIYSGLESVTREDNYNKRGNLTTKMTLKPTSRLELVLRHDYNKKFNATKAGTDAGGGSYYRRDLNQTISKLDLGLSFKVAPGITVETATYRTRDDRTSFGRTTTEKTDYSGEIWVGSRVNRTWRRSITLSALVKKYNAFGPSVTESSANYWEADVWLKWEF